MGRGDRGFGMGDQRLDLGVMGAPFGEPRLDGIAIARLRAASARQARFGNIIVFAVFR
jgi:hypothetical protein